MREKYQFSDWATVLNKHLKKITATRACFERHQNNIFQKFVDSKI
jgi:hypothetical protein